MLAQALPTDSQPRLRKLVLSHEGVLALLLVAEVVVFSIVGRNFWTAGNAFEIVRLGAEIGLLALALTPVIVTGGIDLSVGSLMGLSAVLFGKMWRDGHLPLGVAPLATPGIRGAAGRAKPDPPTRPPH